MWSYIERFAEWLKDLFLWLPRKLWAELLDSLAGLVESIGTPDFILQAQQAFNGIPSVFIFFATKLAIPEGIAMMLAALVLRFILRRIPLIG
ncbi:hypothetical protein [Phytopseudomonas daroniae]|uniref:hypothetical protein n=1 Tax=Phytopseudomonas daroniae TaxID=2487519 RepID=UPI001038458C|nr:hypothetical protein [Pseudomonas daroniae]TBU73718.1 hypothetical protein DNK10_17795 [Pseudomonas daroniae]